MTGGRWVPLGALQALASQVVWWAFHPTGETPAMAALRRRYRIG